MFLRFRVWPTSKVHYARCNMWDKLMAELETDKRSLSAEELADLQMARQDIIDTVLARLVQDIPNVFPCQMCIVTWPHAQRARHTINTVDQYSA